MHVFRYRRGIFIESRRIYCFLLGSSRRRCLLPRLVLMLRRLGRESLEEYREAGAHMPSLPNTLEQLPGSLQNSALNFTSTS
jgi:hypothetical protein